MPKGRRWPKRASYERLLARYKGKYPPLPEGIWKTDPKLYYRLQGARALWRRKHDGKEYAKFGKRVLSIRRRMKKSQVAFAEMLGVSEITVRRWECGYGSLPMESAGKKRGKPRQTITERLDNLDRMLKDFRKQKIKLEE